MSRPPSQAATHSCQTAMHSTHAFDGMLGTTREGLVLGGRRGMLKAGLAGLCGLGAADLLRLKAVAREAKRPTPAHKSVILLWMTGGPSHIDTWDPKPGRPAINRGPFGVINTKLPGVTICEHLPRQAAMLDKFTIIRSVDARHSNHTPNKVFQTANLAAEPRTNPEAEHYPAIASIVAKHRSGAVQGMPPYVAFLRHADHVGLGGYLGKQFDPFEGNRAARLPILTDMGRETGQVTQGDLFRLPLGLSVERLNDRRNLLREFDRLRAGLDLHGSMSALDAYQQQAAEMVLARRAQDAFDLAREPQAGRERYGKHLWCQQALLARRLVEAGVSFVTIDLSYHPSSGTWDTHGDNIPPYGGITRGLGPLLPLFDHLITTLVADLDERGLLDKVLVMAMGEFGRTPNMGTQGSSDGRNHWPVCMSMALAGGGLRHGQVIGSTEADGGDVQHRPVTPGDLAATIYRHMGVPLDGTYLDTRGRPRHILDAGGQPLAELF